MPRLGKMTLPTGIDTRLPSDPAPTFMSARRPSTLGGRLERLKGTSIRAAAGLTLCVLAACGSTPSPPIPAPPAPLPRPGTLAYTADFTAPMGIALGCGGGGYGSGDPFSCDLPASANWGVLNQPQAACPDPTPNKCFQPAGGVMGFTTLPDAGMALISAQTAPKDAPISVEEVVTATLNCSPGVSVSYVGPVLYDGEGVGEGMNGKYYALYLSCWAPAGDLQVRASAYSGLHGGPAVGPTTYAPGSTHALRIDYYPGDKVVYSVDEVPVLTETAGSLTPGPIAFAHDPHPAMWFGGVVGSVSRFDWFTGP